jgi:methanogenic corrinoid protein MtbC1
MYSQKDVEHLLLLKRARSNGQRIAAAAAMDDSGLKRIGRSADPESGLENFLSLAGGKPADHGMTLESCFNAVKQLDPEALRRELANASMGLSRPALLSGVVAPLMAQIGRAWAAGGLRIIHEHLASAVVREFLFGLLMSSPPGPLWPRMVVATPVGQSCEIGALMSALTATDCGWRADYFGAGLPVEEIAAAAVLIEAKAVALSITCRIGEEVLSGEIEKLNALVGYRMRLFAGGRAAYALRPAVSAAGGVVFDGLRSFADTLLLGETA